MTLNEELKTIQDSRGKDYVDPFNDSIQKKGELICPRPGELAPMFELLNENGEPVKLENILKQGPVILSFFKGDFCQLCDLCHPSAPLFWMPRTTPPSAPVGAGPAWATSRARRA